MSSTSTIGALGKVINTAITIVIWLYPVLTLLALKLKKIPITSELYLIPPICIDCVTKWHLQ